MAVRAFTTENYKYITPPSRTRRTGQKDRPKVEWMDKQNIPSMTTRWAGARRDNKS